jgi:hypothetical protein
MVDEMKWSSSSGFLGVLAANKLGFGLALAEISNLPNFLASDSMPRGHGMSKISHTQSCFHSIDTSLIGPIYGGNGQEAVVSLIFWLQT